MSHLPIEFFKELTFMTIQKEARWMEYEENMEDFHLLRFMDETVSKEATVFLCGYIPQLDMELVLQAFDDGKGIFYSVKRDSEDVKQQEFTMSDFQEDFVMNMLVYAATSQVMQRDMESAYHNVAKQLAEAKSSCSGCTGCSH